ncbi:NlpC/P60 family protein [Fodinibius salinus]|nr:NlpC/P60 family protein [Fodinibius salinus]
MTRVQAVLVILLVGLLVGCGVVPRSSRPSGAVVSSGEVTTASPTSPSDTSQAEDSSSQPPPTMAVSSLQQVKSSLMQAYRDWEGTPYKLGGESQQGIDCSRFVHVVFDDYFGIDLPTNTKTQLNVGNSIRRAGIRSGDLVFFRTGRKTLHVGIAVNSGEFLHASTSNGVMISKLGNSYWRNRFLAARRVL